MIYLYLHVFAVSFFQLTHDWLRPPSGMVLGDTHGLCQDASGLIYLAHTVHASSHRPEAIAVFTADGEFVRAFGAEFRGGAHGLALRAEADGEFLYHCDVVRCEVVKTDPVGRGVWRSGYPSQLPEYAENSAPFIPTNVAFAPDGSLFVADGYGAHHVIAMSADGKFLRVVAHAGDGPAGLRVPHGAWVDDRGPEPRLVVADRGHFCLQVFTLEGKHLLTVDEPRLRKPCHFDQRGDWLACADLDGQVVLLDQKWRVRAQIGDGKAGNGEVGSRRCQTRAQFSAGTFISPHAAIFLGDGDILVAEWLPIGRVTRVGMSGFPAAIACSSIDHP